MKQANEIIADLLNELRSVDQNLFLKMFPVVEISEKTKSKLDELGWVWTDCRKELAIRNFFDTLCHRLGQQRIECHFNIDGDYEFTFIVPEGTPLEHWRTIDDLTFLHQERLIEMISKQKFIYRVDDVTDFHSDERRDVAYFSTLEKAMDFLTDEKKVFKLASIGAFTASFEVIMIRVDEIGGRFVALVEWVEDDGNRKLNEIHVHRRYYTPEEWKKQKNKVFERERNRNKKGK